ncbi:MAG TPA: hypothetical protein VF484_04320 [Candidatus Limnocylindrales bacterium]
MKTTYADHAPRARSPLGAHIRFLMDGPHGNVIQSIVPPTMVGRAARFRTVDEYWYVLSGSGEMWRRAPDGTEHVTPLVPGVSVDVALGTAFQYRCIGTEALVSICTAMPPWPGDDEAIVVDGPWQPNVDVDLEKPARADSSGA